MITSRPLPILRITFIAGFVLALLFALYTNRAWEDYYITFRSSKNLASGNGLGGVLLTITNIEIITLTSLGVLVGAVSLALSFNIAHLKSSRLILGGVAMMWIVVGGYAAWKGARVMYARADVDRTPFVRLENAPPELRYLEGVRLDANLRESLLLTARELQKIKPSAEICPESFLVRVWSGWNVIALRAS